MKNLKKERISQLDVDVNNTIEFFNYINDLITKKQINLWVERFGEDLKKQSINYGQPFGLVVLSEYSKLILDMQDLFILTNNYIARAEQLDSILSEDTDLYKNYNPELFIDCLEQLKLQPTDFQTLNNSFHLYMRYCIQYEGTNLFLGVYNKWKIKEA